MQINFMLTDTDFGAINPTICGWADCSPGYSFGPVERDFNLLHYVTSGQGVFYSRGMAHSVMRGGMFVIHPYETTRYEADIQQPWAYIWLGFQCTMPLPQILQQPVIPICPCADIFHDIKEKASEEIGRELFLCSKIYQLLATLSKYNDYDPTETYIARARKYIETEYMQDIHIQDIADMLSLDRSYFSRLFKKQVGMSPQEYLIQQRLRKAAEYIQKRGMDITEAAAACGYKDISTFSRMFSRRFGVSPLQYKMHVQDRT